MSRFWTNEEVKFLRLNKNLSYKDLAKSLSRTSEAVRKKMESLGLKKDQEPISLQVLNDLKTVREKATRLLDKKKYDEILREVESLQKEKEAILEIKKTPQIITIDPRPDKDEEATAIIVASDWHSEEEVRSEEVNDLNRFNLQIAEERIKMFFQNSARLVSIFQKESKIDNVVLALLGDFISGNIHDEFLEINQLEPTKAIYRVQCLLVSGIRFLLSQLEGNFTIVCHCGNHSRITEKRRNARESGNSLEWLMYHNIAELFADNNRVKFLIAEGYHSYLDVYGYTVRFHHGSNLVYHGGVGGIFVPVNKAIAEWNKGKRADLDVFGHWHQFKDGGNFICNGSLIGYNAYSIHIKGGFERPTQAFFLIDPDHGKTVVAPIWLE